MDKGWFYGAPIGLKLRRSGTIKVMACEAMVERESEAPLSRASIVRACCSILVKKEYQLAFHLRSLHQLNISRSVEIPESSPYILRKFPLVRRDVDAKFTGGRFAAFVELRDLRAELHGV